MVFESLVVDVLNKTLKDYVKNLDSNQLRIGIWGGDVILKNLILKETAFEELNLPVQVIYGELGKLVLKIPWKNLYKAPVEATVENLNILVAPIMDIKYNAEKEEQWTLDAKLAQLARVEIAKKKEAQKGQPKPDDSFMEKLAAQIIRNVQIKISNIHVRFEDCITDPNNPYALGCTLSSLVVETTNESWKQEYIAQETPKTYKVLELIGLTIYCNPCTSLYSGTSKANMEKMFLADIATKTFVPQHYKYMLGPINSTAKLRVNLKPELDDFLIPKFVLNLELESLALGLTKLQYTTLMVIVDAMSRMTRGQVYRKYRPNLKSYIGNYREWWMFAYTCILEGTVRRRRRMWNWNSISEYRNNCRKYAALYKSKLENAKVPKPEMDELHELEKLLNVDSLLIFREKAKLECIRIEESQKSKESMFGRLRGWWAGPSNEESSQSDYLKQFEQAMTPAEKQKLYKAIDYVENDVNQDFPSSFIDKSFNLDLKVLQVCIADDEEDDHTISVINAELQGVNIHLNTRVSAKAMLARVKVGSFNVFGVEQGEFMPQIAAPNAENETLCDVLYETNPLDGTCDQRVVLNARPMQFVHDVKTAVKVIEIFRQEETHAGIQDLQMAAQERLEALKTQSVHGVGRSLEERSRLDLQIDIVAPVIVVPFDGLFLTGLEAALIIDLGRLKISSEERQFVDVKKLQLMGKSEQDIMDEMLMQSYDKFNIAFTDLQVLINKKGEEWRNVLNSTTSTQMHILNPLSLLVNVQKALIIDDTRIPRFKVQAKLPSVNLNMYEERLILLIKLLRSIQFPSPEPRPLSEAVSYIGGSTLSLAQKVRTKPLVETRISKLKENQEFTQLTDLDLCFVMDEFNCFLYKSSDENAIKTLELNFKALQFDMIQQTFNMNVTLRLSNILLTQFCRDEPCRILTASQKEGGLDYIFILSYFNVSKKSAQFHNVYKSVEQQVDLRFTGVHFNFHERELIILFADLKNFERRIMGASSETFGSSRAPSFRHHRWPDRQKSEISTASKKSKPPVRKVKFDVIETILFKIIANMEEIGFSLFSKKVEIMRASVRGMHLEVVQKKSHREILAKLMDIVIVDPNPETLYKKIISVSEEEILNLQIVMFDKEFKNEEHWPDMSIRANLGCITVVFLSYFLQKQIKFLSNFQDAQAAIIQASAAAAEAAKYNVQKTYENAIKIQFNIRIKAPNILIPGSTTNSDAILVDLGYIMLNNTFQDHTVQDVKTASIDILTLQCYECKVTRVNCINEKIHNQRVILLPVSLNIVLQRSLSAWCQEFASLDVVANLETVKISLTHLDYQKIFSLLLENFEEGFKVGVSPSKRTKSSTTSRQESSQLEHQQSAINEMAIDAQTSKIFLKFAFTMKSVELELYSSQTSQNKLGGLAKFILGLITFKGHIFENGIASFVLLLYDISLEDTRENQGKISLMIGKKVDEEQPGSSEMQEYKNSTVIDMTCFKRAEDTFIELKCSSFFFLMSMDYIRQLKNFFDVPEREPSQAQHSFVRESKAKAAAKVIVVKEPILTFNLKIDKPDFILVESMDDLQTHALIFNAEVVAKYRQTGTRQVVNASIENLQLYTCKYDPAKRSETHYQVLHPFNVNLAGSTPSGEDEGLNAEMFTSDIILRVSPDTISLLNRCYITLYKSTQSEIEKSAERENYYDMWKMREFNRYEHWFLHTEMADEAIDNISPVKHIQEMCLVNVPRIVITVEAGVGTKTLPMLVLKSSLEATINNWSSDFNMENIFKMEMLYYNNNLAVWEPIIERVETETERGLEMLPWELKFQVQKRVQEDIGVLEDFEEMAQTPEMSITISSSENLEITFTKTCLEVINNLNYGFAAALADQKMPDTAVSSSHKMINYLGIPIKLLVDESSFTVLRSKGSIKEVVVEGGAEVLLVSKNAKDFGNFEQLSDRNSENDHKIVILVGGCKLTMPVVKADKRFFSLKQSVEHTGAVVCEVIYFNGAVTINIRTIIKVFNNFDVPIDVYYMTKKGDELECVCTVKPGGVGNLPLSAVYSPTGELFFGVDNYTVSHQPIVWKDLLLNVKLSKTLKCSPKHKEHSEPFVIQASGEMEQVYFENTTRHTMASTTYNINLWPVIVFKNCLPYKVVTCVHGTTCERVVEPGCHLQLVNMIPGQSSLVLKIPDYLEKEWCCRHTVQEDMPEFSVWEFNSYDSVETMTLDLGMHLTRKDFLSLTLYCPFWMINKTGLHLSYKKSKKTEKHEKSGQPPKNSDENINIIHHPEFFEGPVLFSFNSKNFFGKKKATLRVGNGEWSSKFSLDVAGSTGVITCKKGDVTYNIGVQNFLTYNSLTKEVIFVPYYVLINKCSFTIYCQEMDRPADPWTKIDPESCASLWPRSTKEHKLLRLKTGEFDEISASFFYSEMHTTLLRLYNKFGGVNIDVQINEGGTYVTFLQYQPGTAPCLIFNDCKLPVTYYEKESMSVRKLSPGYCQMFTWENPAGPRRLVFNTGKKKEDFETDLKRDDLGEFGPTDTEPSYWISFLDGIQRVLLFTDDFAVVQECQAADNIADVQSEFKILIHGLGFSLVHNLRKTEVLYAGIASTGIAWETAKSNTKRFKALNWKTSELIEDAYQRYLMNVHVDKHYPAVVMIDNKTEVDFISNFILRPQKKKIRRSFQPGLWINMKTCAHQFHLHAKINRLQIDNQMYDCLFPIIFAPVPPPKSIDGDKARKPFMEISIVQRTQKHSYVLQYKYFKILTQEFHVKIDLALIRALVDFFEEQEVMKHEEQVKKRFENDMKSIQLPLFNHVTTISSNEQKNFYDFLHFSPLKIHVSFSLAGRDVANLGLPPFINIMLQSIGVTVSDLHDVVFKLAYFERNYQFLTRRQLLGETTDHYLGQFIKQVYVLILGLDVLGNPYGLVRGISQGVEDLFYEPFQGAIQGPGEFAEGLMIGMRSLLGHTVGGAAGAASRITGAMGKGIAALTFDKEFQRKRRDLINKKPTNLQEGIARSGKGLVMGVLDGFTGVFTKPISGAKEEGIEGFFKGLGKGAVGLVAQPTAGVIDFASGSLDAVKRAADLEYEVRKLRPTRQISASGIVKAYTRKEADGNKIAMEVDKGKYAKTDSYVYHYEVIKGKDILLLTDQRVAYVVHSDLFGGWQVDWYYTWQELNVPITTSHKGINIQTTDSKKKMLGMFKTGDSGKIVLVGDERQKAVLLEKMEELRKCSHSQ